MPRAGIALGSNLGDRMANLDMATHMLREIAIKNETFLKAPVYQTEPLHCPPDSPDFLNTVVEFGFDGTAAELLEKTRAIEISMGRSSNPQRNAPRVIDVDILYLGNEQCDSSDLILPHPRLHERRFVLQPLADIRPELVLEDQAKCIAQILKELKSNEAPLVALS